MTINDFKPGQVVFVIGEKRRNGSSEYETRKRVVKTVGRKYIRVSPEGGGYTEEYFQVDEEDNYLTEKEKWNNHKLLFTTEEEITDYLEKEMQKIWINEHVDRYKLDKYSLDQLREIRRILEVRK